MAKGEDRMKHLKILHLEDNAMKQTAINFYHSVFQLAFEDTGSIWMCVV